MPILVVLSRLFKGDHGLVEGLEIYKSATMKARQRQRQLIMKYSLDAGTRDDSPNSVIAHSATLSHTSSASGSMEHHMFHPNPREQRSSISDEALCVECAGMSNSFNKADPVDSSAESDLDSAKLLIQKRSTQNSNSEQSSPDYKSNTCGTRDSKGFDQSPRLQSTTIVNRIKSQGAPVCMPKEHIDAPKYSFSEAIKECHTKKLQTRFDVNKVRTNTFAEYEDLLKDFAVISTPHRFKERKRPASMDLIQEINSSSSSRDGYHYSPKVGNVNALRESPSTDAENPVSPSLNGSHYIYAKEDLQKKRHDSQNSASGRVRTFPSPGTPSTSTHSNSWSLERVSMAANSYRNGLLARQNIMYTKNMKSSLPSKWDDAEKWLCSAASGDNIANTVHKNGENSRKPKSKSGPLVAVGSASPARPLYYSKNRASTIQAIHQYSPRSALENGLIGPGIRRSGSTGAAVSDNLQGQNPPENSSCLHLDSGDTNLGVKSCIIRSASVDGWSFQPKELPIIETRSVQAAPAKHENYIPELPEQKRRNAGTQISLNRSQSTREVLPVPIFSQDKYADMVLETPRLFGSTSSSLKKEMVVVQSLEQEECESMSISMKDAATEISPTGSRRDMATQITPLGSSRTSRSTTPKKCNSPARHNTPARSDSGNGNNSTLDVLQLPTCHLAKLEIGNVDHNLKHPNQVFTPNPGKKQINSSWSTREEEEEESSKCLRYFESGDWRKNIVEARAHAWEEAERSKCLARFKREEAKITAWENHQKAKAEAELKKLEVKLEKVRSHTTEKIMNKVAAAHKRAEDMRATIAVQQAEQLAKTMDRAASVRKTGHAGTLGACFSFSCNV